MTKFTGFNENQMAKISNKLGYQGPPNRFHEYLMSNERALTAYNDIQKSVASQMDEDEMRMDYAEGGVVTDPLKDSFSSLAGIGDATVQRMAATTLPTGGSMVADTIDFDTNQDVSSSTGTLGTTGKIVGNQNAAATTNASAAPTVASNLMTTSKAAPDVATATAANTAAQGTVSNASQAAGQTTTTKLDSVEAVKIAEDNKVRVDAQQIANRNVGAAELVDGASANQAAVSEMLTAAGDTTVSGNLAALESQFDNGAIPAWAAGQLRTATALMQQRGLGASSMAGQSLVQAALEASIPIAVGDANANMQVAQVRAAFLNQEFDQAYQARVLNATKVSEVANMKFSAEQQIAMENARISSTVDLNNLSNAQAVVMTKAAEMSQVNMANLNNRQQAEVLNAQSFLAMDMTNLNNEQQTSMFNAQSNIQAILTDKAAQNAASNFNATSQNQTDQFFANLTTQISQSNAAAATAVSQFNAGQGNALEQFDKTLENQRDQFNAQNEIVIAQANAQWRRDIATQDTAATNFANQVNAEAVLDMSNQAYANLWQQYSDTIEFAFTGSENEKDRIANLTAAELRGTTALDVAKYTADQEASSNIGGFVFDTISNILF